MSLEKLVKLHYSENIAESLDKEVLTEIGKTICEDYRNDLDSRREWQDKVEEGMKLAQQILPAKNFPWPGCSNVSFPLLPVAVTSFAARVYPEIIQDDRVVKVTSLGEDLMGDKADRAERISRHMSYQRLIESESWEADTDRLLHVLPLVGVCFRKVYYDPITDRFVSEFCIPSDVVVNHYTRSLEDAERVTHRIYLRKREIIERMRAGIYLEIPVEDLDTVQKIENQFDVTPDGTNVYISQEDQENLFEVLEQHCYLDLDEDGYAEPYIVVVEKNSEKVLSIYARYNMFDIPERGIKSDVKLNEQGEIVHIKPCHYFVDYHFIHAPDGSFHSLGYAHLLTPIVHMINTLMNQLIDAGTLANTQSGFISRQFKMTGGALGMTMGQFYPVDIPPGSRIEDSVFPMPFKEPSPVLLQLLSLIIDGAREIAAINDVLTGQANPQNSPAGSVAELANQGLKLHNAIVKRFYRSLKKEFKLLFKLNQKYLDPEKYALFGDSPLYISVQDYATDDIDIATVADPALLSQAEKAMQANALMMLLQQAPQLAGALNIQAVLAQYLKSLRISNEQIQQMILPPQPPAPDPKMMIEEAKLQRQLQKDKLDHEVNMSKAETDRIEALTKSRQNMAKVNESEAKIQKMQADALRDREEAMAVDRELDIKERETEIYAEQVQIQARKPVKG